MLAPIGLKWVVSFLSMELDLSLHSSFKSIKKSQEVLVDSRFSFFGVISDYSCRSRTNDVMPTVNPKAIATFNTEELSAIITTSHAKGVKVAAHANTSGVINTLLDLGVDSIEIYDIVDENKNLLRKLSKKREQLFGSQHFLPTISCQKI